jgi:hypothetical protein
MAALVAEHYDGLGGSVTFLVAQADVWMSSLARPTLHGLSRAITFSIFFFFIHISYSIGYSMTYALISLLLSIQL